MLLPEIHRQRKDGVLHSIFQDLYVYLKSHQLPKAHIYLNHLLYAGRGHHNANH